MELRDKNGLTEAEFLASYSPKDYPRPSFTADIVVFRKMQTALNSSNFLDPRDAQNPQDPQDQQDPQNSQHPSYELLLIRRGGHPYLGCWALPGGFVSPKEDADSAAARELEEETSVANLSLEPLGVYSTPGRDPRGWTVSAAYLTVLDDDRAIVAGDDAADAQWFALEASQDSSGVYTLRACHGDETLSCSFSAFPQRYQSARARLYAAEGFAFDHAAIIADAYLRVCHSSLSATI